MTSKGSTLETIHDIIKCTICLNSPKNPRFCPKCNALFCFDCIKKWIETQPNSPTCPACRTTLNYDNLSSNLIVSNILNELSKSQEYIQPDLCKIHNYDMIYYCNRCQESICSDCALFQHNGHNIEKISIIYNKNLEILKIEEEALKKRQEELMELNNFLESDSNQLLNNKNKVEEEINLVFNDIKNRLNQDVDQRYTVISTAQQTLNGEMLHLDSLYDQLVTHYKRSPSQFIASSATLTRQLQDIHKNSILEIYRPISTDLVSETSPPYEHRVLRFTDFLSGGQHFTSRVSFHGTTWEIKCGLEEDDNVFINLKLLESISDGKYFYKFTLINQNSNINKVYEPNVPLHIGKSIYIPNFTTKDDMIKEGYMLPENDILLLEFGFRSPSFYSLCHDLKSYIKMLENQNNLLKNRDEYFQQQQDKEEQEEEGEEEEDDDEDSISSSSTSRDEEYFGDDEEEEEEEIDGDEDDPFQHHQHIHHHHHHHRRHLHLSNTKPLLQSTIINNNEGLQDEDGEYDEVANGDTDDEDSTSSQSSDQKSSRASDGHSSSLSMIVNTSSDSESEELDLNSSSFSNQFGKLFLSNNSNNSNNSSKRNIVTTFMEKNSEDDECNNNQDHILNNNQTTDEGESCNNSEWENHQRNNINCNHNNNNNNNNIVLLVDQSHENTENEMYYEEMEPISDIFLNNKRNIINNNNNNSRNNNNIELIADQSTTPFQDDYDDESDQDLNNDQDNLIINEPFNHMDTSNIVDNNQVLGGIQDIGGHDDDDEDDDEDDEDDDEQDQQDDDGNTIDLIGSGDLGSATGSSIHDDEEIYISTDMIQSFFNNNQQPPSNEQQHLMEPIFHNDKNP